MNAAARIRAVQANDHTAIWALWDRTPDLYARLLAEPSALARYCERNPGCSQVAVTADDAVVGVVMAGHDGVRGSLHHLAVDPAWRRRGLARQLVVAALCGLAAEGIEVTTVWIYDTNTDGRAFWAAMGYEAWEACPTWSRSGPPP